MRRLLEAGVWNSQINWIANDEDVQDFYERLIAAHSELLSDEEVAEWREAFY